MNKRAVYIGVAVVVAIACLIWVKSWFDGQTESATVYETAQNAELSIAFAYPGGEHGYSLIEPPVEENMLDAWILMPTADYASFKEAESSDAPASMSVFIFSLPDEEASSEERAGRITRLQNWATDNKNITLIDRAYGTPDIVELDGVKALKYDTTGLFEQSIYLASYRSYVYMFVGQYNRPTDDIKQDFEELIASVRFE